MKHLVSQLSNESFSDIQRMDETHDYSHVRALPAIDEEDIVAHVQRRLNPIHLTDTDLDKLSRDSSFARIHFDAKELDELNVGAKSLLESRTLEDQPFRPRFTPSHSLSHSIHDALSDSRSEINTLRNLNDKLSRTVEETKRALGKFSQHWKS
jgi:hypothetical protein